MPSANASPKVVKSGTGPKKGPLKLGRPASRPAASCRPNPELVAAG